MTPVVTAEATTEAIIFALLEKIKTIEWELNTLKASVFQLAEQEGVKIPTFADLRGVFPDLGGISEEEIDAALYREPPFMDDFPEITK